MLLFDPDHARPPKEQAYRPSLSLGWMLVSGVEENHLWREISQRRLRDLRVTPR